MKVKHRNLDTGTLQKKDFRVYCRVGCSDLVLFFDFTIWPPFMNEIYLF